MPMYDQQMIRVALGGRRTDELGFALLSPEKQIKIRKSRGDLRMKFIVLYSHEITISEKYKKNEFWRF